MLLPHCRAIKHPAASSGVLTHRGKPPAMPGDSSGCDLYDGRCVFLISTKRKEIHDGRISEPEPYKADHIVFIPKRRINPQPGRRGRAIRSNEARHGISRQGRLMGLWAALRALTISSHWLCRWYLTALFNLLVFIQLSPQGAGNLARRD
jgi:hypothetical protein